MINKLSAAAVKRAHERNQTGKLSDGGNLYLQNGRYWRQNYRWLGKQQTIAHGVYPKVSLQRARELRDQVRELLAQNKNPKLVRINVDNDTTFKSIALKWHDSQMGNVATAGQPLNKLKNHIFPILGDTDIRTIDPPLLLSVLRMIESAGTHDTAIRVRALCSRVFRYGIAIGACTHDPARDLEGALTPHKTKSFAFTTDKDSLKLIIQSIQRVEGHIKHVTALKLVPYFFVRPGMLRFAEWKEIDFDRKEWRIPADKMKRDNPHIVPLSSQPLEMIRKLKMHTGGSRYLFPHRDTDDLPMSAGTLLKKLRSTGLSRDVISNHGFRHVASTMLNEAGWSPDYIEIQLSHSDTSIRGKYNYAQYLDKRHEMMQVWADVLDGFKAL